MSINKFAGVLLFSTTIFIFSLLSRPKIYWWIDAKNGILNDWTVQKLIFALLNLKYHTFTYSSVSFPYTHVSNRLNISQ